MVAPATPTAFRYRLIPDTARVLLAWNNGSGTGGNKIEASLDHGTIWSAHYDDADIEGRYVFPCVSVPDGASAWTHEVLWRVSAQDGSGHYSDPTNYKSINLPPVGVPQQFFASLTSVDEPSLFVPLGAYDQPDASDNWMGQRDVLEVTPAGQTDSDWIYSPHTQYVADQMDWPLYSYNQTDGRRVTAKSLADRIDRMWREAHLLLYRNHEGLYRYCRMFSARPRPYQTRIKRVAIVLKTAKPPLFPLTQEVS